MEPGIGAVVGGKYRIEQQLGVGAIGAVYRVRHVALKKQLALKVLLPEAVMAVLLVQVTVCGVAASAEQLQPAPVTEPATKLRPVGSGSVTVTGPLVAEPPAFVTVKL